ncbi:hypothetical protein GGX14DRAFT_626067 [Mycena pura]|uniref:DUF4246 domain-containing protein n=1 Tax=Mycena pura TaxID=153505 RepID=A0AAD6YHP1_9AGAR|nr:hypothetical protein GGX14DRAFT_626067 [Mycena pura]
MYGLSWSLRSKPDWQRKAADPKIRAKWREEAIEQAAKSDESGTARALTLLQIDYVLSELDGYVKIADNEKGIERACFEAIWYSDRLISEDVMRRLKIAASVLENVPDDKKDWHPGSNGQVLDLVHPSLYCVVYSRTHAYLPGKPRTADNFLPDGWISEKFCWMPSDFTVADDGSVSLASPYINNLHLRVHQPLYRVIEEILAGFIPMFERVLGDVNREDNGRLSWDNTGRLGGIQCIWGPGKEPPYPEGEPGSDEDEDEFLQKFRDAAEKVVPAATVYTGQLEERCKPVSLRGRTIQCIVKLANIHLTPEKPEYAGGSWHVEGMVNERIIASGIYYYDEDNITESKLSFRVATAGPEYHMQDDIDCMKLLYGMARESECVQEIGEVVTKAGRALAWPNLFQHCVSPFKLADATKAGHRKILALFLVDPTADPVVSATDVPPQQAEWAAEALEEAAVAERASALGGLSRELRDLVRKQFPASFMTLQEAEAYRLTLMEERTAFVADHTEKVFSFPFNMCEH